MKIQKKIKKTALVCFLAGGLVISSQAQASWIGDILDDLNDLGGIADSLVTLVKAIAPTNAGQDIFSFTKGILSFTTNFFNLFNFTSLGNLTDFLGGRSTGFIGLHDSQQNTAEPTKQNTANSLTTNNYQSSDAFQSQLASYKSTANCTSGDATNCPAVNAQAVASPTGYDQSGAPTSAQAAQAAGTLSGNGVGYSKVNIPSGQAPTPEAVKYTAYHNTQVATQSTVSTHLGKAIGDRTQPSGSSSGDNSVLARHNLLNSDQLFGGGTSSIASTFFSKTPLGGPFTLLFQLPPLVQSAVSIASHMSDTMENATLLLSALTTIANMAMQFSVGEQMLQSAEQSLSQLEGKKSPGG